MERGDGSLRCGLFRRRGCTPDDADESPRLQSIVREGMTMTRIHLFRGALTALALMVLQHGIAHAELATFTWNPAGASPALGGAGSAFTADSIVATNFLSTLQPTSGPFPEAFVQRVQGFTLNGAPVSAPGLNGTP